jgi:hypothetical protein
MKQSTTAVLASLVCAAGYGVAGHPEFAVAWAVLVSASVIAGAIEDARADARAESQ